MDINQRLLDAFQAEHIEHLEGIRASLTRLAGQPHDAARADLDEAFRRAHSLKGAARITGMTAVETLAHRLESLFARIRDGGLVLDERVSAVVSRTLDCLEDSSACLLGERAAPDITQALRDIDRLVQSGSASPPARDDRHDLQQRLRAAFDEEHQEYLARIRQILSRTVDAVAPQRDIDEAFRCAHSLKGAATVAGVPGVDELARPLEAIFSRVRQGTLTLDESVLGAVAELLSAVEAAVKSPEDSRNRRAAALSVAQQLLGGLRTSPAPTEPPDEGPAPTARAAPAQPATETLRLSAGDLDRLLQSTGQLLTEALQQERVARELSSLGREVTRFEKVWQAARRATSVASRLASSSPEMAGIARWLETLDQGWRELARHARDARLMQQRSGWSLTRLAGQLQHDLQRARIVPAESEFQGFRRMMRELGRDAERGFDFQVTGLDTPVDRLVLQALKDPLMHLLRNAVAHGVEPADERRRRGKSETGQIALRLEIVGHRLQVSIDDDGRGFDAPRIAELAVERGLVSRGEAQSRSAPELTRLLLHPGFSTSSQVTELSGRGMGLSIVHQAVTRLQGELHLRQSPLGGAQFLVSVPVSLATHRLLMVSRGGQTFAVPLYGIEGLHRVRRQDIQPIEGHPAIALEGKLTPLVGLEQLLGFTMPAEEADTLLLMVLEAGPKRLAVAVDALLAEREALIKNLQPPASRIAHYAGGILLEDGSPCLVLNPWQLVEDFRPAGQSAWLTPRPAAPPRVPTVLIVDDSFTTRTLESSILEAHGYQVRVAVDGVEALSRLRAEPIDLVVSDIQMPRLDGFGLLEQIKQDQKLTHIPVIIVSSMDRREDQQRGLSLGADAYIVKRKFDRQELLDAIEQLL